MKNNFRMIHLGIVKNTKSKKPEAECDKPCKEEPKSCPYTPTFSVSDAAQQKVLQMPHFLRVIGSKQISVFLTFIPALLRYGFAATCIVAYGFEFKTVLQYLPFYNGKYFESEVKKPQPPRPPITESEPAKKEC